MAKILSGIYAIVNKVNGKRYVGSAVDIAQRWRQHTYKLRKNNHHSKHLQNAWNKYGNEAFDFIVLEIVDDTSRLIETEQKHLDECFPHYNNNRKAGSILGFRFSEETKLKMSKIHTGFRHTKESIKKMSEYWSGRPRGEYSEERRKNMSLSKKGKPVSDLQKEALARGRAKQKSEETKKRMSESQKGYKPAPETIEKLKQAWVRRKARENAES